MVFLFRSCKNIKLSSFSLLGIFTVTVRTKGAKLKAPNRPEVKGQGSESERIDEANFPQTMRQAERRREMEN